MWELDLWLMIRFRFEFFENDNMSEGNKFLRCFVQITISKPSKHFDHYSPSFLFG